MSFLEILSEPRNNFRNILSKIGFDWITVPQLNKHNSGEKKRRNISIVSLFKNTHRSTIRYRYISTYIGTKSKVYFSKM